MIMGGISEEMSPLSEATPLSHLKNIWRKSTRKLVGRNTREEATPVATRSPVAPAN
jgi:hypothetical protein